MFKMLILEIILLKRIVLLSWGGSFVCTVARQVCVLLVPRSCASFQEIDGHALLLLKSEMMMKYLGLKLGPALKLSYHIDKLKQSRL